LPGKPFRRDRAQLRGEVPFARVGAGASLARVDLEGLVDLAAVVAFTAAAPGERHLVLIHCPRSRHIEAGAGRRLPAALRGQLPVVARILLPIAIGVPGTDRQSAGGGLRPVRAAQVYPVVET